MRNNITPMILTLNEEANIGRTLERLTWAKRIVVVDSGSTDRTLEIVGRYPQAAVFYRQFDTAAQQCNFGLGKIDTDWVLSLDADYVLSDELVSELAELRPESSIGGFWVRFVYRVYGRQLRGSLYPNRIVLYRKSNADYLDEGHTQRVQVHGAVARLRNPIYHDDRKPLGRWFASQARYAALEATHLLASDKRTLGVADRIRLLIVLAPLFAFFYALIFKLCALDGWPGWLYATERLCAEAMLSIEVLDRRLRTRG